MITAQPLDLIGKTIKALSVSSHYKVAGRELDTAIDLLALTVHFTDGSKWHLTPTPGDQGVDWIADEYVPAGSISPRVV